MPSALRYYKFHSSQQKKGRLKRHDSAINLLKGHFFMTRDTHFVRNPVDTLFKIVLKTSNHKYIQGCHQRASFG